MLEEIKILHETEKSRIILLRDSETKKKVIRKELRGNHSLYEKLKEYKHPYLPEIYSVEEKDGKTIILEEYIEGVSLDRAFLSERILTRCFLEMCQVLDFLHFRHILHRDIKPEHILLAPDHHIRLIDFDAAREPKAEASQDTCLLGTKGYAAPEQYGFSQTDERADIYSLGITFQTLLGPVARKKRWRKLLRKCTDMDPKGRFSSAHQIRNAFYRRRFFKWGVQPVCMLVVGFYLAVFISLFFEPTVAPFMRTMFGLADTQKWESEQIDTQEMRNMRADGTAAEMYEYQGPEVEEKYQLLKSMYPDKTILYSGYMDKEGALVYGYYDTVYDYNTGRYTVDGLITEVKVGVDGTVTEITSGYYDEYMPAIMALNDKSTWLYRPGETFWDRIF